MYYLGLDFGTSGARAVVLSENTTVEYENAIAFFPKAHQTVPDPNLPRLWAVTLFSLMSAIPDRFKSGLKAVAIDGTSSTVLLCDRHGHPVASPMMYNDACPADILTGMRDFVPLGHPVLSPTSSLAKLMAWFNPGGPLGLPSAAQGAAQYFVHQADWLAAQLHGQFGLSDYHNSLKLGYDPETESYPSWFNQPYFEPIQRLLPQVVPPGSILGRIQGGVAQDLGLPDELEICAGTTDSIAAFLASGIVNPGAAVTSLGSTLVLKLLSRTRVDRGEFGIYSHRLGPQWLVGGASNTGGAVLAHFFSATALKELSQRIDPQVRSPLPYYPLLKPGERFPYNDPDYPPCLAPRPDDPIEFLHGLLESMARIEAAGYQKLALEGATPLTHVLTAGGGAQNQTWTQIRQRVMGVPVGPSAYTEAAYGAARLAMGCLNPLNLTG